MKITFLALLLLMTAGVAAASVVKFSDKAHADTESANDFFQTNKSHARPPAFDIDNRPHGLRIADSHNNVPDHVFEQVERHPLGCCRTHDSVDAVPLPAAAWLFISGLFGLIYLARHHRQGVNP